MADKWQTNGWTQYPSMAAARSQLDSQSHQLYTVNPLQAQLQGLAQPQSQATGSSSLNNIRPNDNLSNILGHLLESLNRITVQQRYFNDSLATSDRRLEELLFSVSSIRETADGLTKKLDAQDGIKEALERSSRGEDKKIDVMKVLVGEMKAFKKTLGKSCDGDDGRTVLGRLDAVTFAVGELLERARDPEANLPEPSTSTTAQPCIIDLTRSSSPLVGCTSPVHSRTYADMGTSPVPSHLPMNEKSSGLIRASSQCGSDSFTPYPGRSLSAHTFASTTSPDTVSTALTQDNLELAYPIPMDEDTVDSTEPTIDSQKSSTMNTNNSETVSQTQKDTALSNASVTTTEEPQVETIRTATAVHLSMPSGLASPNDAQNSPNITTSDESAHKNDKPEDTSIRDARLLNVNPGLGPGVQTLEQPYTFDSTPASTASTASASSASPALAPTPFTQTEVQRSVDKTIAALKVSARLNPYLGVVNSSVSEGKQLQKEQSEKQGLPEQFESPPSTSARDEEMLWLDNINSEKLNVGADGKGYKEVKINATKGAEEIKNIEKRTSIELNANRIGDVPAPVPGIIDLRQVFKNRRGSSSPFASPSTSLFSLSIRGRTGSRHSLNPLEDVSYSSSSPSDTKSFPTKMKGLAGASVSRSSATPPPTTPAAASPSADSGTTRTPVPIPVKKAASVSSQSAFRPNTTNAELVAATIPPATPVSNCTSPAISTTNRITPAASASSHLESASTSASPLINKFLLSQTCTPPAATSTIAPLAISPTTPVASSRLGPVASPAAMFELPPPSQTSTNMTQDEDSVNKMVIEKENENNEGEAGNLVEKTTGNFELKVANGEFEEEEEGKEEGEAGNLVEKTTGNFELTAASREFEKEDDDDDDDDDDDEWLPDRLSSSSLSPLSSLTPSISGSPYRLPVKVSGPSTPRPRSLSFTPLPRSPLASASSKNQTQIDQAPEPPSPPPNPFVAVASLICSPTSMNLVDDQPEPQSPLFSSPSTNGILVEQRKEEEESVSHKLKSPDGNNGTTDLAIPTAPSKVVASVLTHIPTQTSASIETLLPRNLSPISEVEVEKRKRTVERTDKTQVEKVFASFGDNADIVRVKKRKVSEGSVITDREPLANPVAKEKGKEIDDLEVVTKSGEAVKKRSLLNLKVGKKGESLAVTRVRKRKARPDFIVDGEANDVGRHDDGLDEEKPLKRARQRVSDTQMKTEPTEKGKQVSRQFSGSSFGGGTSTRVLKPRSSVSVKRPPSKARLSVNGGQEKVEVEWPTKEDDSEDLVECDKCKAWYHYGCVGLTVCDKFRQGNFFCPPCKAGTTIKKLNMNTDCWRPGCSLPAGFVVEKIIGRFRKFIGGKKYQFKYLLQWKGYNLSESSWEPEESMFDPSYMIETFREDAFKEGIDIEKEQTGIILLQVAKDPSVPQPT